MATNKIPPLLEPYLGLPPEASLIILSGVLGASTNWLVQRYLCSLLGSSNGRASTAANGDGPENGDTCVVLVSFMRDYAFWKEGAGRLGLDLDGLAKKNIFKFVDGLSGLFSGASGPNARTPVRGTSGEFLLRNATLDELQQVVQSAQQTCASPNTVLILDNPDLLLAASGSSMSGEGLRQTILHLREVSCNGIRPVFCARNRNYASHRFTNKISQNVSSTIITLAADEPLISAQNTSLEKDHASLALSLAHEAGMLITLRLLDTGTAKDVSGVLRVTPGGDTVGFVSEERELLYFVGSDGGVRVFERGQ